MSMEVLPNYLISLLILYLIYLAIGYKKMAILILRDKKLSDLKSALLYLSKEMNNQSLLIKNDNDINDIIIVKYQKDNLWGLKVLIDMDIFAENQKLFIPFFENNSGIIRDDNNITKDLTLKCGLLNSELLVHFIFRNILKHKENTKYYFSFEKMSMVTIRIQS